MALPRSLATVPREALFLAGLSVLALLGFGLVHRAQESDLTARQAQALAFNRTAVRGAEEQVSRTLEAVTTLHDIAAFTWLARLHNPDINTAPMERLMEETTSGSRFGVLQVAITDERGMMTWSTLPGWTNVNLADRDHIRSVLNGSTNLFVSKPLIGRVSGKPTINIGRAIRDRDGRIVGASVTSIDPLHLSAEMATLNPDARAVTTVLRDNGSVMARSRDAEKLIGSEVAPDRMASMVARAEGESLNGMSVQGEPLFTAWRKVSGWPLYILYGQPARPVREANAAYGRELRLTLFLTMSAAGAAGMLGFSLWRQRSQRQATERAEALRQEMAELVDALPGVAYRSRVPLDGGPMDPPLTNALARVLNRRAEWSITPPALDSMLDAEGHATREALLRQVLEDGESSGEYRVNAPGLGPRWLREQCRVLRDGDGDFVEVVGLLSDITGEREIKANAITAAKLATLGEMATGVAHELNQPCAIIGLAAEVALMEIETGGEAELASARGRLEEMVTQTERMRGIINHLRDFGRADDATEQPVPIHQVVDGALGIATGVLRDNGIQVEVALPEDLPPVRARRIPLEQALVNLLLNARDAMQDVPRDKRAIRIGLVEDGGGHPGMLGITLRDHGSGIPEDILPRIFEPFFTTRPVGRGTGLGLSITYSTLRSFGGAVEVANHPDGGAIATLWLQKVQDLVG